MFKLEDVFGNEMRERIYDAIVIEAKLMVKYAEPMKDRAEIWNAIIEIEVAKAYEKYTFKRIRKTAQKFSNAQHARRIELAMRAMAKSMDMDYAEWVEKANTYYSITQDGKKWIVTSTARSPKPENNHSYDFASEWEAKEKVLKLISYKYNDHFVKGHDFRW